MRRWFAKRAPLDESSSEHPFGDTIHRRKDRWPWLEHWAAKRQERNSIQIPCVVWQNRLDFVLIGATGGILVAIRWERTVVGHDLHEIAPVPRRKVCIIQILVCLRSSSTCHWGGGGAFPSRLSFRRRTGSLTGAFAEDPLRGKTRHILLCQSL